jgi:chorismate-pyruvate lyase
MTLRTLSGLPDVVRRYFLLQGQRPDGIEEVEMGRLEPFLRGLLFTDGTVTRALAVQTLDPVSVKPLSQEEVAVPAGLAAHLEVEPGAPSIRRRVAIGTGSATFLWAESHLLPSRLPADFFGALEGASDGIGQSVQRAGIESCRELLWFGLAGVPEWAPQAEGAAIHRLYRLVSDRRAAILISESFGVEWRSGAYRLAGLDSGPATEPSPAGGAG